MVFLHPLRLMSSLATSLLNKKKLPYGQVVPHDTKITILVLIWFKMCKVMSGPWDAKEAQYGGVLKKGM